MGPATDIPDASGPRDVIVSASAGLPKKDFPLLVDAMAALPGWERQIILARSNGLEDVPDTVARAAAAADPAIQVRVNVAREEVLATMARAVAAIYTLVPDAQMGWPMSIIEAMLCGAIVIGPDRPEARELVGEHLRTYRSASDIADHVRDIAAGGPAVDVARAALVERAQRYREPAEVRRLHDTLRDELTAWRASRLGRPHRLRPAGVAAHSPTNRRVLLASLPWTGSACSADRAPGLAASTSTRARGPRAGARGEGSRPGLRAGRRWG